MDPRFKKAAFGTIENGNNAEKFITDELSRSIQHSHNDTCEIARHSSSISKGAKDDNDVWSYFDETVSGISSAITPTASVIVTIKQRVERFQESR